jgi:hypothetical protein
MRMSCEENVYKELLTYRYCTHWVLNAIAGLQQLLPIDTDSLWSAGVENSRPHLPNFEFQFNTIDIGVCAVFTCVLIRNFCPSLLTA